MIKVPFALPNLALVCLILTIPACKTNPSPPLSGDIELNPDWKPMVYLVQPRNFNEIVMDYLGEVVDSTEIAPNGHFAFAHITIPDEKLLITLAVQQKESAFGNHLADEIPSEANYMPLVLSKDNAVVVHAQITHFLKTCAVDHPSQENRVLLALRNTRLEAYKVLRSSSEENAHDESALLEQEDAYNQYTKPMRDFADSTRSLEAALVATRWVSPSGDFERTPEFLHGQCQKWSKVRPEHPFVQDLCAAADKNALPVMLGDVMPDYALPLVTGDTVMLHEMLGKRLTVVDIWASWCAPCRKENRVIMGPLWSAYGDKGLQIIGYSIDGNGPAWKNAIVKDGADWTNASHLTGDATPFLEQLRITTIPANFILDEQGNILAKNVFGQELTRLVKAKLD